jgi:hypothetical protein
MWLWYGQPFEREKENFVNFLPRVAETESKSVAGGWND